MFTQTAEIQPADYPVKTGFGLQILKCTDFVELTPRTSVAVIVSVNSLDLSPLVLT